jgi:hypothetical protein
LQRRSKSHVELPHPKEEARANYIRALSNAEGDFWRMREKDAGRAACASDDPIAQYRLAMRAAIPTSVAAHQWFDVMQRDCADNGSMGAPEEAAVAFPVNVGDSLIARAMTAGDPLRLTGFSRAVDQRIWSCRRAARVPQRAATAFTARDPSGITS